jgi:hypothetical protein
MPPSPEMLGWYTLVVKQTLGGGEGICKRAHETGDQGGRGGNNGGRNSVLG